MTLTPVCSSYCATSFFTFSRCESDRLDDQTSSVVLPSALLPPLEDEPPHAASESAMLAVSTPARALFHIFLIFHTSFSVFVLLSLPLYFSAAYSALLMRCRPAGDGVFIFRPSDRNKRFCRACADNACPAAPAASAARYCWKPAGPAMPSAHIPPAQRRFLPPFSASRPR